MPGFIFANINIFAAVSNTKIDIIKKGIFGFKININSGSTTASVPFLNIITGDPAVNIFT